ncbi:hypothetical protein TNCV_2258601 [Trichonephila clavipes]|nr:hypothetical protein TNCV_2258601 [Trichonephila clavipes]
MYLFTSRDYQNQIDTYYIFYKRRNHMTCVPTILPTPVMVEPATLRLGSGYATSKPPGPKNTAFPHVEFMFHAFKKIPSYQAFHTRKIRLPDLLPDTNI